MYVGLDIRIADRVKFSFSLMFSKLYFRLRNKRRKKDLVVHCRQSTEVFFT